MKILVTGASGFVGSAMCGGCLAVHGFEVVGAVRRLPAAPTPGIDYRVVDELGAGTDWHEALAGTQAVIHCAARVHVMRDRAQDPLAEFRAVNTAGTVRLARTAAQIGVKRFIFLSSIKVNGERTPPDAPFDEASIADPQDPYAVSKREAEQALARIAAETGLEVVKLRLPLVYGPGVKGNFLRLLQAVERGIPLPLAGADNRRSLLYLENLTGAIAACLTHPDAVGKTYLISDGEDVSTAQLITRMAQALDKPVRLWPAPPAAVRLLAGFIGKSAEVDRLFGSLRIDSGRIRRELGWVPPHTLAQGLAETVRWFRKQDGSA